MGAAAKATILRIELWHSILLLVLLVAFAPAKWVDSTALLAGGIFMGVNFLLLSMGIAWILTPLASKGRIKAGIGLLILKLFILLALLTTLFFRFDLDAVSFALGFSTLILAIVIESIRKAVQIEDQ
jgi:hypothetical protein